MKRKLAAGDVVITADQIAAAPSVVQDWLRGIVAEATEAADSLILERDGTLSSGDGLAICSGLEIKALLRRLSNDYVACQVLFALGCDLYDPLTGERREFALHFHDFRGRTDIADVFQLDECLGRVNEALREIRHDRHATIHRRDHDRYHVHGVTQQRIYRFWRHLVKSPAVHLPAHAGAPG
jgi:hypothetical protein